MNDYVIFTDSTCDLSKEHLKELDVNSIPLKFILDEKAYDDDSKLTYKELYDLLREKKHITTSKINTEAFIENFEPFLKNQKDILYIAFSSGLSGTYESAKAARDILIEKYPDRKLIVVDSLCACLGEGLLVHYAAYKRKSGMGIDELYDWIEKNKLKVCHWFTVDDLFYLKRGGRVSSTAALFGTMLGIKPVMHMGNDGKLHPVEKARGRKAAYIALVEHMKQDALLSEDDVVFIAHADCPDGADFIKKLVLQNFKVKQVFINYIGSVIGSHAGPGTLSVFFWGKNR